jgi:hypothetical protein
VTETGPLVVVDASTTHPDEADWLADMEATKAGATVERYVGLGHVLPGDPYAPDGAWLHVYATSRLSGLAATLAEVADGRCSCLADRGEHPHTARGCDVEGCGCRWVPPPITDTEEGDTDA